MSDKIIDLTKQEVIVPKENTPRRPIHIRTLNLFVPLKEKYEKLSRERKSHKLVDMLFVAVIILLCVLNFILVFKKNNFSFTDLVNNYFHPSQAKLEMNLAVNDKDNLVADPGEKLNYILTLKNNSAAPLTDLEVKIKLDGAAVDEKTLISKGKFVEGNLIWTVAENEALKNFKPGEEISFDFNFFVKKEISTTNPNIATQAFVSGFLDGKSFSEDSPENRVKINSDFSVAPSYAFYTAEGEQIGGGAWPPQVDSETALRVFLTLSNNINKIENAKLIVKLAPGMEWTNQIAVNLGAPLEYDLEKQEITWQIGTLATSDSGEANFKIKFTPTDKEIGKNIKLLESIQISGRDSFTGAEITRFFNPLIIKEKTN
ncbi:MAG: hypothetical protein PHT40_01445 [Patescibacteria group bacterium]|nr:hypothetical protein [Patescibacteria group bacterium]